MKALWKQQMNTKWKKKETKTPQLFLIEKPSRQKREIMISHFLAHRIWSLYDILQTAITPDSNHCVTVSSLNWRCIRDRSVTVGFPAANASSGVKMLSWCSSHLLLLLRKRHIKKQENYHFPSVILLWTSWEVWRQPFSSGSRCCGRGLLSTWEDSPSS